MLPTSSRLVVMISAYCPEDKYYTHFLFIFGINDRSHLHRGHVEKVNMCNKLHRGHLEIIINLISHTAGTSDRARL